MTKILSKADVMKVLDMKDTIEILADRYSKGPIEAALPTVQP